MEIPKMNDIDYSVLTKKVLEMTERKRYELKLERDEETEAKYLRSRLETLKAELEWARMREEELRRERSREESAYVNFFPHRNYDYKWTISSSDMEEPKKLEKKDLLPDDLFEVK